MLGFLWKLDSACHWLNRWWLLPAFAFKPLCDWCDRRLIESSMPDDFYEPDEPVADVLAAFDRGEIHLTEKTRREIAYHHRDDFDVDSARPVRPWRPVRPIGFGCQHMSMTAGNGILTEVQGSCGCDMQPIYASQGQETVWKLSPSTPRR